jgi:hypothetical protein
MDTLATRFARIITSLRAALGVVVGRDRAQDAVLAPVWSHLGRTAARFGRLFARFLAGTLPKPSATRPRRAPARAKIRLSEARGWLVYAHWETRFASTQLQHWFTEPDLPAFLAAAPQAARLLRPLCRLLAIAPPELPQLPPRQPRKPRPKPAKPPRLTRREHEAILWYPNYEGKPMQLLPPRKKRA